MVRDPPVDVKELAHSLGFEAIGEHRQAAEHPRSVQPAEGRKSDRTLDQRGLVVEELSAFEHRSEPRRQDAGGVAACPCRPGRSGEGHRGRS